MSSRTGQHGMTEVDVTSARPIRQLFFCTWAILSLLCCAWAIATPIAAVPDEPAHLIKAASVVRGEFVGDVGPNGQQVSVPQWVAYTHVQACFAFDGTVTADCSPPVPGNPAETVTASTTAGLYNPTYYLLVGLPSLVFSDSAGVFAMRVVSGIATSAFLALTVTVLAALPRRRLPLLGMLVAVTPMVLFLGGSVNPNGLETAATLAAFVGVLSLVANPQPRSVAALAVAVSISAAVAVNMRGLSPLWVAIALAAPLILTSRETLTTLLRRTAIRWMIAVVGIAGALALMWIIVSGSLVSGLGGIPTVERPQVPYTGASPLVGFYSVIQGTFELAQNMVGIFGWLDTPAPPGVYFVWCAFVGALIVASFVVLRGRSLLLGSVLALGVVIIPALVQAAYITGGGYIWQGRYTLPLFVCAIIAMTILLSTSSTRTDLGWERRLSLAVIVLWAVAQFFAFAMAVRRYSVGVLDSWVSMVLEPLWSPPGGVILSLSAFAALLAALSILLYRLLKVESIGAPSCAGASATGRPGAQQVRE